MHACIYPMEIVLKQTFFLTDTHSITPRSETVGSCFTNQTNGADESHLSHTTC